MEPLSRCENGHYFDAKKHSSCPFCGVQGLDIDIKKTMAKKPEIKKEVQEEKEEKELKEIKAEEKPEFKDLKTVGVFKRKMGADPVVGWLVAIEGPEKGRDYRITSEKNFVGRSEKMDVSIQGDESVSRDNHAIVSYNPKNHIYRLFPGESRGLVYLNEEEVVVPETLKVADVIGLGQTKLMFVPLCGEHFHWQEDKGQS